MYVQFSTVTMGGNGSANDGGRRSDGRYFKRL